MKLLQTNHRNTTNKMHLLIGICLVTISKYIFITSSSQLKGQFEVNDRLIQFEEK